MVSHVAFVAPVAGTTTITGQLYPATPPQALDGLIIPVSYKAAAGGVAALSGWLTIPGGGGGGVWLDYLYKEATGAEGASANVGTITITGSTASISALEQVRPTSGCRVKIDAILSGADASSDLSYSATTGTAQTKAGQFIYYVTTLAATSTRTARTLTQAGSTLGTLTARYGAGTGMTQEAGDRTVTTPAGTPVAIVNTYTLGTATTGLTGVLLLSDLVTGPLSGSLPAFTGAFTGRAADRGTAAGPLPAMVGSFAGRARATGAATGVLPAMVAAITGRIRAVGAAVGVLPALVGSLLGRAADRGTAAGPLPALVGSFTGAVTSAHVTAVLTGQLPAFTGQVLGTVTAAGPTLNLQLTAEIEPDRYQRAVEAERYGGEIEPNRYLTGVES